MNEELSKEQYSDLINFISNRKYRISLVGSRAYGVNQPNSDYDFIIIATNTVQELLGFESFKVKHYQNNDIDVKVYSLHSYMRNILKGSPNCIDAFFSPYTIGNLSLCKELSKQILTKKVLHSIIGMAFNTKVIIDITNKKNVKLFCRCIVQIKNIIKTSNYILPYTQGMLDNVNELINCQDKNIYTKVFEEVKAQISTCSLPSDITDKAKKEIEDELILIYQNILNE